MSGVDLDAVADRVARGLETQRRKVDSYAAMMGEVGSSEDSEDDAPVRRRTFWLAPPFPPSVALAPFPHCR